MNEKCADDRLNIPKVQIVPPKEIFKKYPYTTKYKNDNNKKEKKIANVIVVSYYDKIESEYIDDNYNFIEDKNVIAYGKAMRPFKCSSLLSFDDNGITNNGCYGDLKYGNIGFVYDISDNDLICKIYGKQDVNTREGYYFDQFGNINNQSLLTKGKTTRDAFFRRQRLRVLRNKDNNDNINAPIQHLIQDTDNILNNIKKLKQWLNSQLKEEKFMKQILKIKNIQLLSYHLRPYWENIYYAGSVNEINDIWNEIKEEIKNILGEDSLNKKNELLNNIYSQIATEGFIKNKQLDMDWASEMVTNLKCQLKYQLCDLTTEEENNFLKEINTAWHKICNSDEKKVSSRNNRDGPYMNRKIEFSVKSSADDEKRVLSINGGRVFLNIDTFEPLQCLSHNELVLFSNKINTNNNKYIFPLKSLIITKSQEDKDHWHVQYQQNYMQIINFQMSKGLPFIYVQEITDDGAGYKITGMLLSEFFAETADKKDKSYQENIDKLKKYEEKQFVLMQENHCLADDFAVKNILTKHPELKLDVEPQKEKNEHSRPQSDVIQQEEKNITIIEDDTESIKATRKPFWLDEAPLKDKIFWNIATLGLINLGRFGCCNGTNNTATL